MGPPLSPTPVAEEGAAAFLLLNEAAAAAGDDGTLGAFCGFTQIDRSSQWIGLDRIHVSSDKTASLHTCAHNR